MFGWMREKWEDAVDRQVAEDAARTPDAFWDFSESMMGRPVSLPCEEQGWITGFVVGYTDKISPSEGRTYLTRTIFFMSGEKITKRKELGGV